MPLVGEQVAARSDTELWELRGAARGRLVSFVRERLSDRLAASGMEGGVLDAAARVFDPDALTIGLARRFAEYKRPTLLLRDEDRLARLITNRSRPVQIVVAGKAHPQDAAGKDLVCQWVRLARRADVRLRVVFLADYDLRLAERLVQGVDLWINTPRPPWEACGTSGMKILVNGGLNRSFLHGWWDEAYGAELGRAPAGDGRDDGGDAGRLYEILENAVVPAFYERDPQGLPREWISKMRASMSKLTPAYSANRAVREYCEHYYLPAADAFERRSANGGEAARAFVAGRRALEDHWEALRFGEVRIRTEGGRHHFAAALYIDDMNPDAITVELYADPREGGQTTTIMRRDAPLIGARGFTYVGDVRDSRPAHHFTPRVLPAPSDALVPLELPMIVWASQPD